MRLNQQTSLENTCEVLELTFKSKIVLEVLVFRMSFQTEILRII